jgi:hypothetical protein
MTEQLALFELPRALGDPHCGDCGIDTIAIGEYYMVRDDLWPLDRLDGMLCIGCLERRLGRELAATDFDDAPVNRDPGDFRSRRLRARLAKERHDDRNPCLAGFQEPDPVPPPPQAARRRPATDARTRTPRTERGARSRGRRARGRPRRRGRQERRAGMNAARARALEHTARILARAMERRHGGSWRGGLGTPGPSDAPLPLAGELDGVVDREDVGALGDRRVAGDDHDGLDDAA